VPGTHCSDGNTGRCAGSGKKQRNSEPVDAHEVEKEGKRRSDMQREALAFLRAYHAGRVSWSTFLSEARRAFSLLASLCIALVGPNAGCWRQ